MYFLQSITSSLPLTTLAWNQSHVGWNQSHVGWNTSIQPIISAVPAATGIPLVSQVVEIVVGAAGRLSFNPESLTVFPGTILRFDFLGRNHTLTQSSLEHPCLNSSHFDTGFNQFNPTNVSGRFVFEYVVQSNSPEWFYCAQESPKSHCEAGMLFSLNPGDQLIEFVDNRRNSSSLGNTTLTKCDPRFTSGVNNSRGYIGATGMQNTSAPRPTSITPEISNEADTSKSNLVYVLGALLSIWWNEFLNS